MNKVWIVKKVIHWSVAVGTGKIVSDIIENNTDPSDSLKDKITYKAGGYAIGAVVADRTTNLIDARVDSFFAFWDELKYALKDADFSVDFQKNSDVVPGEVIESEASTN